MSPIQEAAIKMALERLKISYKMCGFRADAEAAVALEAALAEPGQEPLSDDEIKRIDDGTMFHESSDWSLRFARAIEQAHGIS